jgi:hypothetical protein
MRLGFHRVWAAALLALPLAACRLSASVATIPRDGSSALVLIVVDPEQTIRAEAADFGDDRHPDDTHPLPDRGSALWVALRYDCTLAALGLPSGPFATTTDPAGRSFPGASRIETATVSADSDRILWQPTAALPRAIQNLRISAPASSTPSMCAELDYADQTIAGTSTDSMSFMIGVGHDDLLLVTEAGRFLRGRTDGIAALPIPRTTPRTAATLDASGTIWLIGRGGAVASGDLDHGFRPAPSLPSARPLRAQGAIDAAKGDAAFELFAVTDGPDLLRFDGSAWSSIPLALTGTAALGSLGIAWAAHEIAIVIGLGSPLVGVARNGTYTPGPTPLMPGDAPNLVKYVPGFGVVLGSEHGVIASYDPTLDRWTTIVSGGPSTIRVLERFGDRGLLYGGLRGALEEYQPGMPCDPIVVSAGGNLEDLVEISDGYFTFSRESQGQGFIDELMRLTVRGQMMSIGACP